MSLPVGCAVVASHVHLRIVRVLLVFEPALGPIIEPNGSQHAISTQSARNQHAINTQSTRNQHAISMQSARNQHAITEVAPGRSSSPVAAPRAHSTLAAGRRRTRCMQRGLASEASNLGSARRTRRACASDADRPTRARSRQSPCSGMHAPRARPEPRQGGNQHAISLQSARNQHAISMQSERSHLSLGKVLVGVLLECPLDRLLHVLLLRGVHGRERSDGLGARQAQSRQYRQMSCAKSPVAISVPSACNQHAISMPSACHQHVISMPYNQTIREVAPGCAKSPPRSWPE
jgi:hypothetical protein